ncbi:MAG: DNA polymerase III subunit delta' [Pseudomonadota bacterium]
MVDDRGALIGHDGGVAEFLEALDSGKLHHAWLLTGQHGIGKALFALHASAVLLSQAKSALTMPLFRDALSTPAARQMLQGSHPDFRHIQPAKDKATQIISVDQIRTLAGLFQTTAGMGGWRIAIIDAADDMNRAAANAILKLLEEPPPRSVFFLISHTPGKLLPTIRSRCRTLRFQPLANEDVAAVLASSAPEAQDDMDAVLAFADGSPGRALSYLEGHALDYSSTLAGLFDSLPHIDRRTLLGLADQMGDRASSPVYKTCWSLLQDMATYAVRSSASGDGVYKDISTNRWLAFADGLEEGRRQIEGLNMSPRQALIALVSHLAPPA